MIPMRTRSGCSFSTTTRSSARGCAVSWRRTATWRWSGEAGTAEEALERHPATAPRVAVLDVRLPDGSGVEVCREVRSSIRRWPV